VAEPLLTDSFVSSLRDLWTCRILVTLFPYYRLDPAPSTTEVVSVRRECENTPRTLTACNASTISGERMAVSIGHRRQGTRRS
jgi:hypothetical protein